MSVVPESFKAQINQGVPGNVKARPDPLPAGKKITPNKKNPCELDFSYDDAITKTPVAGRTGDAAAGFEQVESALSSGDYSTAIRTLWYLRLSTFYNEDSANLYAYLAFAFAKLGFLEHVGFALKKMRESSMDQTVLKPEVMTALKKIGN
ncbi:hypothetical protein QFC19_003183 [Naganishia cerealis]|uniref:Uncharacterized protein n=1 Tax=Naganishia cerealis TaxID=610337 RepID=A0ACC2W4V0_9TREE|nr:hypothetical protein QFC19_003183 [Naganishia cerealis]